MEIKIHGFVVISPGDVSMRDFVFTRRDDESMDEAHVAILDWAIERLKTERERHVAVK